MILIPGKDKKISQTNNGDVLGSLYFTKNINFDKAGYISLARKTQYVNRALANASSATNFGTGYNAIYDPLTSAYAIVASGGCYIMHATTLVVTRDDSTNNPGDGNDNFYWNGALYFLRNGTTGIQKRTNGVWAVALGTIPTNTDFHTFCLNEITNELLFTDGNLIQKITTGDTISVACTLPANFRARWIVFSNNRFFIGTLNTNGGNGKVFYWDGVSTVATISYDVNSQIAVSGCKYKSTVACMNSLSQMMMFDGSGFTQVASLPVYNELEYWVSSASATGVYVPMFPKSMKSQGDLIYLNLGNTQSGRANGNLANFISGIWCYDPAVGLYQKFSPTPYNDTTGYGSVLPFTVDSGLIAFLAEPNYTGSLPALTVGSEIIYSMRVPDTAYATSGAYNVICSPVSGENRGYFVTNKIYSQNVTDTWQRIYIKFRGLFDSNDKIKIKYRIKERTKSPVVVGSQGDATCTWTTTTTFTADEPMLASVIADDDFEIWTGRGAGKTAKVVSNTLVGSTYTVVLDTAIGTVGDITGGSFWNWTALKTFDNTSIAGFAEIPIAKKGKFVQLKVELEGEGGRVQVEELQIINDTFKPSV